MKPGMFCSRYRNNSSWVIGDGSYVLVIPRRKVGSYYERTIYFRNRRSHSSHVSRMLTCDLRKLYAPRVQTHSSEVKE